MTGFLESAIARAGFGTLLSARRRQDLVAVLGEARRLESADLLIVGALADLVRQEEVGDDVHLHDVRRDDGIVWVDVGGVGVGGSDLQVLRAVAMARITGPHRARIGADWGKIGLELAQVALAFGASDLVGPITRKSGLPIYEDETKKVKGEGMVDLRSLKQRELARIVSHAGRTAVFVGEGASGAGGDRPGGPARAEAGIEEVARA